MRHEVRLVPVFVDHSRGFRYRDGLFEETMHPGPASPRCKLVARNAEAGPSPEATEQARHFRELQGARPSDELGSRSR
jgi:hypothetical protein